MSGCLCGDPECPSCGPAQGRGPETDATYVHDWLELEILRQYRSTMPHHPYDAAVTLADRLGAYPEVAAAMAEAAAAWHANDRQ